MLVLCSPWPVQNASLHAELKARNTMVMDLQPDPIQALSPASYSKLQAGGNVSWVVGNPSLYVTDVILFLSSLCLPTCVALLVPCTYIQNAPTARQKAFERLQAHQRLCFVSCVSRVHEIVSNVWVVVFKSPTHDS